MSDSFAEVGFGPLAHTATVIWPPHACPAEVWSPVNPGHDARSRTERLPFYNPSKESYRWTKS